MKGWLLALRIIAALLLATAFGCADRSEPEPVDQSVRPARIFVVQDNGQAQQYEFVGRVEAAQSVDMTFEVSGPLAQLPVREGQTVKKDELVAALESKDFELAVEEAQVQLQLALQDLQRKQQVLAQKAIARSVVDDAKSNFELQRVRLEKARESLADASLIAPFDAYVARRFVDNYVNVRAGEKIVRLNDMYQLLVIADVPESLFATVSAEQVLKLHAEFDFAPGVEFPLQTYESSGEADSLAQTYEVAMSMERPSQWNIFPGMTATVNVALRGEETAGVLIPASALVSGPDGSFFTWIFDAQDGLISRRDIEVGVPVGDAVSVSSGLTSGEMIVATGVSQLVAGMRVRVLGEPTSDM